MSCFFKSPGPAHTPTVTYLPAEVGQGAGARAGLGDGAKKGEST